MIAEIYIESAKNIRNEFLRLSKKLDSYQNESAKLVIFLEDISKQLEDYSKTDISTIKNKSDVAAAGEYIVKKMTEIEEEEQKIIRLVQPINEKIDKLKVEEATLFKQLKEKYPNMTDEEIIYEVQSNLEK